MRDSLIVRGKKNRIQVLAVLWAGLFSLHTAAQAQDPFQSKKDLQAALENFQGTGIDGRLWDLESLRGRIVLIDFWASWCAPCLAELPIQRQAYKRFREKGFEIIAVNIDANSRREVERFLRRKRLPWPQILDGRGYEGKLARAFGLQYIPASILIDPQGKIAALNLRGDRLLEFLNEIIEQ